MYTRKGMIYADAGKILRGGNVSGYQLPEGGDYVEEDINLKGATLEDDFIIYDRYRMINHPDYSYSQWKAHIVKIRYSLDDQMALLLNKDDSDEDMMYYQKMEEWRTWASAVARKATELNNK